MAVCQKVFSTVYHKCAALRKYFVGDDCWNALFFRNLLEILANLGGCGGGELS